jgi:hypothetical protein
MRTKTNAIVALLIAAVLFYVACSKPAKTTPATTTSTTSSTGPTITSPPLANTVDKTDTLRVMAYNVLTYGDGCQGSVSTLNGYFQTIIQYEQPDLLSCEKMNNYPLQSAAPYNLADDIRDSVLNALYPGRYAYATPTDASGGQMSVLFYNTQKLTFVKTETLYAYISDFDLY